LAAGGDVAQEAFAVAVAQRDPWRRRSMFVRRLVNGVAQLVGCVGDKLPLRADRFLERVEHRVERRPEATQLVVALGGRVWRNFHLIRTALAVAAFTFLITAVSYA
jgi:hypothetical protein